MLRQDIHHIPDSAMHVGKGGPAWTLQLTADLLVLELVSHSSCLFCELPTLLKIQMQIITISIIIFIIYLKL